MTKFLITGASGFVGANFVRRLVKNKKSVVIFVRKNSNLWRLHDVLSSIEVKFVDMYDIKELRNLLKKIKPDFIYHFAAYGGHIFQKDVDIIIKTNAISSFNLMYALDECKNLKRFINIGSSTEYGTKLKPMKETNKTMPTTFEGITKNIQTTFAQFFAKNYRFPIVTLRLFSVYGPYEQPGRLIYDVVTSLIKNQTLKLSTPYPKRDFVFIEDVISALEKAQETPAIEGEVFNIGSGHDYSVGDIVNLAFKLTKKKVEISWGDTEKERDFNTKSPWIANIEKARQILDWYPKYSFKEGFMETYQWYQNNKQIWNKDSYKYN